MTARKPILTAIFGLALLAGLPALAQPGEGGPWGDDAGFMRGHGFERMMERLELSDAQREELRAAFADGIQERAELRQSLYTARRALAEQIHAETFDETAIREAAAALAALEADMAVERARHAQQMREILTLEQLAELESMRDERHHWGGHRGHRGRRFGGPPPTEP